MSAPRPPKGGGLSLDWRIDRVCTRFEDAWLAGHRPRIEEYLSELPEGERRQLLHELLPLELAYRRRQGEAPDPEEYRRRLRELAAVVAGIFAAATASEEGLVRSGSSDQSVTTGPAPLVAGDAEAPARLGRYRILAKLGAGGFGVVYQGYDDDLRRLVAIKVPRRDRVVEPADVEAYLAEARILASLDHPHIVPVHDCGRTDDGLCYVVSKFVEGSDLKKRIDEVRPSPTEAAELMATVAEALHYAHRKGLVHRDIKPGNILLDASGQPYVTDFGLALKEEDFGKQAGLFGTPRYMSPEQARGEGHRVDGRTDIFSLGVVFYELLTGRQPFPGRTPEQLREQITRCEPRPLRQVDETIPKELERICLKALSKRASERYTTAKDMAADLWHWLAGGESHAAMRVEIVNLPSAKAHLAETPVVPSGPGWTTPPSTPLVPDWAQGIRVVPKGLRSFDTGDADFFLELVPGPRDRDGLPEIIRFWKARMEETDADKTFAVGLIYGPSGCGKSSLMKAGLLPRLADRVFAVYIEASASETETRLLRRLRKHGLDVPNDLDLTETLAALRQGQGTPAGKKVLLVLDQFEQWLNARRQEQNTELVRALRQCDGGRVQAVVLVRDDFWMAATRFMTDLEVNLVQGENCAPVDLFDLLHARKVLAAFGRAYGRLPDNAGQLPTDQDAFLDQAVAGLTQDGKVISVRLALFAEMVKGKQWTPATLKEVGGAEGVGVAFLEETFSASTAPPQHRLHQKAAQAVLKALLPATGADLKGNMRSQHELLGASAYSSRPRDFEALVRVLDGELRLITPADPEGVDGNCQPRRPLAGGGFYQLTHDYLVPALRTWLTRRQRETRRGRAELRLAERAAAWNAKPEKRHLPAWWEWANIRVFTKAKDWTASQREMMRWATRFHAVRGLLLAVLLLGATFIGISIRRQVMDNNQATHAVGLVRQLLDAEIDQVPGILRDIQDYGQWTDPLLKEAYAEAEKVKSWAKTEAIRGAQARRQLRAALGLLPMKAGWTEYLYGRLLNADLPEVPVIRDALAPHKGALVDKLWKVAEKPGNGNEPRRLRAASALAHYDPSNRRWQGIQTALANDLVAVPPVHVERWMEALRPVGGKLLEPLSAAYRDRRAQWQTERIVAASILVDYASDQPQLLADLLMDADEKQFAVLCPKVERQRECALAVLEKELDRDLRLETTDQAKEQLATRQTNAAVALLRMNQPGKVWPLLKHSPDPRVRTHLIHRFNLLGVDPSIIVKKLDQERDVTIRRALILSLGAYSDEGPLSGERNTLVKKLQEVYQTAEDAGLHAAAEWLLRHWEQARWLREVDEQRMRDKAGQDKRFEQITRSLARAKEKGNPQWYVTGQGHTMVVIPGPVDFLMGSPRTEVGRRATDKQFPKRISRTFSIASKELTVAQYLKFDKRAAYNKELSPTPDCPINAVSWYRAAAYCNWLSSREDIPPEQWCYEPHATKGFEHGMRMKANYLHLTGYRLPTEAEWEYACRAGAVTSRFHGETEEFLDKYVWYTRNSLDRGMLQGLPPKLGVKGNCLKPNDFGLFDMLGNAVEWCQDRIDNYVAGEDKEDVRDVTGDIGPNMFRVMRGGGFHAQPVQARCADRKQSYPPHVYYADSGFRPARTIAVE
jgi:formylglycine-generating enzyme required for sulfatase activity